MQESGCVNLNPYAELHRGRTVITLFNRIGTVRFTAVGDSQRRSQSVSRGPYETAIEERLVETAGGRATLDLRVLQATMTCGWFRRLVVDIGPIWVYGRCRGRKERRQLPPKIASIGYQIMIFRCIAGHGGRNPGSRGGRVYDAHTNVHKPAVS